MTHDEFYEAVDKGRKALKHYGIPGMKWGIRRYQNPDGTLTELGKKHMEDGKTQKEIDKWDRKKAKALATGDTKFVQKNIDVLSNSEINQFSERIKARNTVASLKKEASKISADKFKDWLSVASSITQNAATMADNGVKLYNTVVKINNSFSSKKLDPIGEKNDDPNKWTSKTINYKDEKGRNITETYGKKGN